VLYFNCTNTDSWRRKQPIISPLTLFIDREDTLWAKIEATGGPVTFSNENLGYLLVSESLDIPKADDLVGKFDLK